MTERLFGIETEYALVPTETAADPLQSERIVWSLVQIADDILPSVCDAAGHGRFLSNGSRFYVDGGYHPEWSTAEVASPWDAVRHVLAGDRWLTHLAAKLSELDRRQTALLYKTNVHLTARVSWGCHESALYRHQDPQTLASGLMPLLVTRVIFTGAGGFDAFAPGLEFVTSPRAMFLNRETSGESTWNRAIVHLKQESLCGHGYRRWHLICGESLSSEIAMWLRSATLALGVSLLEGGVDLGAPVRLASPVNALHSLVRDTTCRVPLAMEDGPAMTALQIQRYYLEQAEAHANADFMPPWTGEACRFWRAMIDQLESAPGSVATTLDWAIRRALFTRLLNRRGFSWDEVQRWNAALRVLAQRLQSQRVGLPAFDPADFLVLPESARVALGDHHAVLAREGLERTRLEAFIQLRRELFEADSRFGQLGEGGLFAQMDREGVLTHHVAGVDNIEHAMHNPPSVGRAALRGSAILRALPERANYVADWGYVLNLAEMSVLDLAHPFETEERWQPQNTSEDAKHRRGQPPALASPLVRRARALDMLLRGDLAQAQAVLDNLISQRFDPPSTWCHAARLAIVQSDLERGRACVREAWSMRADARPYVVARILWYRVMFTILDGADSRPWLARLKDYLGQRGDRVEWTMCPVLDCLRPRIAADQHALLTLLAARLSCPGTDDELSQFEAWRDTEPEPYTSSHPSDDRDDDLAA